MARASVTALVLAFNEELCIRHTIESCIRASLLANSEIKVLVADDGSWDSTASIVESLAENIPYLKSSRVNSNLGIGKSLARCLPEIDTEFFMIIPGDNDLSVIAIRDLLTSRYDADVAIGYYKDFSGRSIVRRFLSRSFAKLVGIMSGAKLRYPNGPGIYRTEIFGDFVPKSSGFASIAELNVLASTRAGKMIEVPLTSGKVAFQKGKSLSLKTAVEVVILFRRMIAANITSRIRRSGRNSQNPSD